MQVDPLGDQGRKDGDLFFQIPRNEKIFRIRTHDGGDADRDHGDPEILSREGQTPRFDSATGDGSRICDLHDA